ncbi:uncharacterized protein BJ171DRAFT_491355 [Polychytrium aggregatum]|uniref:uncharacterized protein n=1 Tax=Polychytrium aggregatum TaxID=110093 RepID=UPI0022FDE3BF|nr:uncharacterized protein BJ171DRAFT_491355 [Polychytrium aggregatum]KAI9207745.1 hypothetical protein BJ171DRAFT_491355 [Polychytrium aggregatum]
MPSGNLFAQTALGGAFTLSLIDQSQNAIAIGSGNLPANIPSPMIQNTITASIPSNIHTGVYVLRLCLTADSCKTKSDAPFVVPVSGVAVVTGTSQVVVPTGTTAPPVNPTIPTASPTSPPDTPSNTGSVNIAAVAGGAVGGVVLLGLAIFGGYRFMKRTPSSVGKNSAMSMGPLPPKLYGEDKSGVPPSWSNPSLSLDMSRSSMETVSQVHDEARLIPLPPPPPAFQSARLQETPHQQAPAVPVNQPQTSFGQRQLLQDLYATPQRPTAPYQPQQQDLGGYGAWAGSGSQFPMPTTAQPYAASGLAKSGQTLMSTNATNVAPVQPQLQSPSQPQPPSQSLPSQLWAPNQFIAQTQFQSQSQSQSQSQAQPGPQSRYPFQPAPQPSQVPSVYLASFTTAPATTQTSASSSVPSNLLSLLPSQPLLEPTRNISAIKEPSRSVSSSVVSPTRTNPYPILDSLQPLSPLRPTTFGSSIPQPNVVAPATIQPAPQLIPASLAATTNVQTGGPKMATAPVNGQHASQGMLESKPTPPSGQRPVIPPLHPGNLNSSSAVGSASMASSQAQAQPIAAPPRAKKVLKVATVVSSGGGSIKSAQPLSAGPKSTSNEKALGSMPAKTLTSTSLHGQGLVVPGTTGAALTVGSQPASACANTDEQLPPKRYSSSQLSVFLATPTSAEPANATDTFSAPGTLPPAFTGSAAVPGATQIQGSADKTVMRGRQAEAGDELSIRLGEAVTVLVSFDDGWSCVRNHAGMVGVVPTSYLG